MKPLNIKSVLVSLGLGLGAVALAYIFPIGLIIMPALLAFAGTVWGYGGLAIAAITAAGGLLTESRYVLCSKCHVNSSNFSVYNHAQHARNAGVPCRTPFGFCAYSAAASSVSFSLASASAAPIWPSLPSTIALAMVPEISLTARMASSLPGIT